MLLGSGLCLASLGAAAAPFELTGVVLDSETKTPLEGAYVVAIYLESFKGLIAGSRCAKTRGMTTGADGRFHFPVERLDGNSPGMLTAIRPDYYFDGYSDLDPTAWRLQSAAAYTNRVIYLKRQNKASPELFRYNSGNLSCDYAPNRRAVAAAAEFTRLETIELTKYGAKRNQIEAGQQIIDRLESLPR